MLKIGGNKPVMFTLVLCVLMQVAAMMPHHHHEGSEVPCIYFGHLAGVADAAVEADDHGCRGGCCSDAHEHEHDPFTVCNTHKLVLSQPEKEGNDTGAAVLTLPDDCHCGSCELAADYSGLTEYFTLCQRTGYRLRPDVEPLPMRYISRSLSPRAPDFVA